MPDIRVMVKAIKLTGVNRILNNQSALKYRIQAVTGEKDIELFFGNKIPLECIGEEFPSF